MSIEGLVTTPCAECTTQWIPQSWANKKISIIVNSSNKDVVIMDKNGQTIREPFFPHPNCYRHVVRQNANAKKIEAASLGPVKSTALITSGYSDLPIYVALADHPSSKESFPLAGHGVDQNSELAELKAKMELIERMCLHFPPDADVQYSAQGFRPKSKEFNLKDRPRFCFQAQSYLEDDPIQVPVEYFMPAPARWISTPLVVNDSTGMAVHSSREQALELGLAESLERIGIYRTWMSRVNSVISRVSLPELMRPYLKFIESEGYDFKCILNHPVSDFNAVTVILFQSKLKNRPGLVCCSGGAWSLDSAIQKAFAESYSQLVHALHIWPKDVPEKHPSTYEDFLYYLRIENSNQLLRQWGLLDAKEVPMPATKCKELTPQDKSQRIGEKAVYINRGNVLTRFLGLECLQVVIPALSPKFRWQKNFTRLPYPYA